MNEQQPQPDNITIGDDGLTEYERQFITTPVAKMSPESAKVGMAMLDKRAEHNYRLNEEYRREQAGKIKDQYAE